MTRLRRVFGARAVTPFLFALVLVCIALGWGRGPEPAAAATNRGSELQAGGSCPLTPTQELESLKAWQKMIPVFRHPRCTNCHGGVPDPLEAAPGTMHVGVVEISSRDSLQTCEECHEEGWRTAGHKWTKLTDQEICSSMKDQFSSGQFLEHIEHDSPPLIEMAFKGRRGLNEGAGEAAFEDKNGGPLTPAPPPGSFGQFVQLAKAWVTAQGGRFVGDKECGCVIDEMEVQFKSTMAITNNGPGNVRSTITGTGKAVVRLKQQVSEPEWNVTTDPDPDRSMGPIAWTGVTVTHPMCTVDVLSSPPSDVSYWLGVSFAPELKLAVQVVPTIERHETLRKCREPVTGRVIAINEPVHHIFAAAWSSLHGGPGAGPMAALGGMPGMAPGAPAGGLDMSKLMSMKPEELEAMAARMQANPNAATGAELGKLMNQVLPGADAMAAAVRTNFRFAIPGKGCTIGTGADYYAKCVISQTWNGSDNKTATQTITETTTITIGKPRP